MTPAKGQIFLERSNYKMRRIVDAMRILPFFGGFMWVIPLIWGDDAQNHTTSSKMIYIFAVWVLLVFMNFLLSYFLHHANAGDDIEQDV